MTNHRPIVRKLLFSILLFSLVLLGNTLFAQDGKALFQSNCASCHNPFKDLTGPALKGVTERVPDTKLLHQWIHNNAAVLASGNKYFNDLFAKYNRTSMTVFGNSLSDADIDAILKYVETVQPPTPGGGTPETQGAPNQTPESDSTLLYGILTLILAVIMFVLLQVNSSLKKMADDKEGVPASEPIPFCGIRSISRLSSSVYSCSAAIG
jgi:cytochrome c2